MNWHIYVRGKAKKQIKKLPSDYIERIEGALNEMKINPYAGDIRKMEGEEDIWRRRIGSYRIEFEINEPDRFVHIIRIERRTSSTY